MGDNSRRGVPGILKRRLSCTGPHDLLFTLANRFTLNGKIVFIVALAVIAVMAVLTALMIARETALLQSDGGKNAEILAATISRAVRDNMLSGQTDNTLRLIKDLSDVPGVKEIAVLARDGTRAFGMPGDALNLNEETKWLMSNGQESTIAASDAFYLIKPLWNEQACRYCHPENEAIRGAVAVKLSTAEINASISDLIRRMTGFGLVTAGLLSALLIVLARRLIVSPIRGLTDASRRIAHGEYVLFKHRKIRCREVRECGRAGCPSFDDDAIPCWLRSGTMCTGEPIGDAAVKLGNCMQCAVYVKFRGDEIRQLEDDFNRMSLTLKKNDEDLKRNLSEVEALNRELKSNNAKLTTLLDASKLMTSTLELDRILTDSMRIILNATDLKAGIILLLEEDPDKRCYDFFGCNAHNCPAYKASVNCWQLAGTMCHGDEAHCPHGSSATGCWGGRRVHTHYLPARNYDEKMSGCSNCDFFANIVLIPKMISGFQGEEHLGKKHRLDDSTIHKALVMGQAMVDHSGKNPFELPIETATEIAMPLKVKEQMIGVLYLASDEKLRYDHKHIEFFQLLSEVISSGIFNSGLYDDIERSYLQTVAALANAVEAKDPYTKGHSERMSNMSLRMAVELGLSRQEKDHLQFAALLHDMGKIGINRDILRKQSALDTEEEKEMHSHPDKGVKILEPVHFLKPVLSAIRHHHEQFDGTGYPLGLKGGEIPFKARILSVADAWDAMRSDRPYRKALTVKEAKKELLRNAGRQFDPEVVQALIRIVSGEDG